jgi:Predicted amidohydrolase
VSSFLAAAVQLTSTPDPDANFAAAEEQIELAARRGADLVGLPENFAFMGDDSLRLELAPALAERCSRFLVTMARRYQVTLLGGGFPVPAGEGLTYNRAELVGTEGQLLARYDKIHLFDVDLPDGITYRESSTVEPGQAPGLRWWRCRAWAGSASRSATTFASRSSTATWPARGPMC